MRIGSLLLSTSWIVIRFGRTFNDIAYGFLLSARLRIISPQVIFFWRRRQPDNTDFAAKCLRNDETRKLPREIDLTDYLTNQAVELQLRLQNLHP